MVPAIFTHFTPRRGGKKSAHHVASPAVLDSNHLTAGPAFDASRSNWTPSRRGPWVFITKYYVYIMYILLYIYIYTYIRIRIIPNGESFPDGLLKNATYLAVSKQIQIKQI